MAAALHTLHVLGVVFIVGPLTILPMLGLRAIRQGDRAQILGLARSTLAFAAVSAVVIALGFGVMSTSDEKPALTITTTWILWSAVFSTIAVLIQFALTVPAMFRAARDADATPGRRPYLLVAATSGISALLLVVTVLLMVLQPA